MGENRIKTRIKTKIKSKIKSMSKIESRSKTGGKAESRSKRGKIHVYTGDGKGKTTAALGLALRAVGAGLRVCIIQFAKSKSCSEHTAIRTKLAPLVTIKQFGRTGFITKAPSSKDIAEARKALGYSRDALFNGQFDVVVLDEANFCVYTNMLSINDLVLALRARSENVEVVVTGRNAHPELIRIADLVTEMRLIKHYFDAGVPARMGIEM